eukprot:4863911-Pyramimonas_sp.AAC.1
MFPKLTTQRWVLARQDFSAINLLLIRVAPLHYRWGQALAATNKHEDALEHLEKAHNLEPKLPYVFAMLIKKTRIRDNEARCEEAREGGVRRCESNMVRSYVLHQARTHHAHTCFIKLLSYIISHVLYLASSFSGRRLPYIGSGTVARVLLPSLPVTYDALGKIKGTCPAMLPGLDQAYASVIDHTALDRGGKLPTAATQGAVASEEDISLSRRSSQDANILLRFLPLWLI